MKATKSRKPRSLAGASKKAAARLAAIFRRNGYVRRQNTDRLEDEGWGRYKKGDEVRLVADSLKELQTLRRLVKEVGFKPGRPFKKGLQYRQPIYGREAVAQFLKLVKSAKNA